MKSKIITLSLCCFVLTTINVYANDSPGDSNNKNVGWVVFTPNPKSCIISEFIIPDGFKLHIKIWKDGKETMDYYEYIHGQGIMNGTKLDKYPEVASLCCIKYGSGGDLKPFSIDLNQRGKGLTNLPECKVENANNPTNSLIISLPSKTPNVNL